MKNLLIYLSIFVTLSAPWASARDVEVRINAGEILDLIITLSDILHESYVWTPETSAIYCSEAWRGSVCMQTCYADFVECQSVHIRLNGTRDIFYAAGADERSCRVNALNRCYTFATYDRSCKFAGRSYRHDSMYIRETPVSAVFCPAIRHRPPVVIHPPVRRRPAIEPPGRRGNHVKPDRWRR